VASLIGAVGPAGAIGTPGDDVGGQVVQGARRKWLRGGLDARLRAGGPAGGWTVDVAESTRPIQAATDQVSRELASAALAIIASAALRWLAGRARRPVERLRAQATGFARRADQRQLLRVPSTKDETAALAATMNELLGGLHGSLEREKRLVADAAHEFRTPLAILRTELELADRPGAQPGGAGGRRHRRERGGPAHRPPRRRPAVPGHETWSGIHDRGHAVERHLRGASEAMENTIDGLDQLVLVLTLGEPPARPWLVPALKHGDPAQGRITPSTAPGDRAARLVRRMPCPRSPVAVSMRRTPCTAFMVGTSHRDR
jgi:signal transduction histidine kinase